MNKRRCGGSILTQELPTRKMNKTPSRGGHRKNGRFAAMLAVGVLILVCSISAVPIAPTKGSNF